MSKPDSVIDKLFWAVFKVLLTIIGGLLLCQAIVNAVIRSLSEPTFTLLLVLGSICAYFYLNYAHLSGIGKAERKQTTW